MDIVNCAGTRKSGGGLVGSGRAGGARRKRGSDGKRGRWTRVTKRNFYGLRVTRVMERGGSGLNSSLVQRECPIGAKSSGKQEHQEAEGLIPTTAVCKIVQKKGAKAYWYQGPNHLLSWT